MMRNETMRNVTMRSKNTAVLLAAVAAILVLTACPPREGGGTSSNAVLLPVADDPTITFSLWFKVGAQNDPPGKEGLASLTAALLAAGATTENSYDDVLKKLHPMAAGYSSRVDEEMTTFTGRTHRDNVDAYFQLYSDAFLRPAFNADDFQRLKNDHLNYLKTTLRFAFDEELGKAALSGFIFEGTPYQHPVTGTVTGLEAITLDDVKSYYRTYFNRENVVVALGGGYSDDLLKRFEEAAARLPEGQPAAPVEVTPPAIEGNHVILVKKTGADASISFGFPISVARGEREFYALWIANSWLGEHRHQASHLYNVIREARGMNYGDYSYIEAFPQGGFLMKPPTNVARHHQIFQVWIRTLPYAQAHFALRAAVRELKKLVENGMTEEDFELTRSFLSKYYLHFAPNTTARLGYAIDDRFYGIGGGGHLARFGEMMQSITREEVNAAIRKHLRFDNLKIAIVTPREALAHGLKADTPSPIEYPTPKPDAVLAEDKEISTFPLPVAYVRIVPVEEIFRE